MTMVATDTQLSLLDILDLSQDSGASVGTLTRLNPSRHKDGFRIDVDLTFPVENEQAAEMADRFIPGSAAAWQSGKTTDADVKRGISSGKITGRPKMPDFTLNIYDPADDTIPCLTGHIAKARYAMFSWDGEIGKLMVRCRFEGITNGEIGEAYGFLARAVLARFEIVEEAGE